MLASFDTIILAGGIGSRLRGVVDDRPKSLAPIAGRPFLAYLLDQLERAGVTDVVLSTGYLSEQVESTFGEQYRKVAVRYSRENQPLGTGGGARHALSQCHGDHLLVINGDSYFDFDLRAYLQWFDPATMKLAMALAHVQDGGRYGQVLLGGDGQVLRFQEKNASAEAGWINAGLYLIQRSAFENFMAPESFSLERDFFPSQVSQGFFARGFSGRFIDIGTPESYRAAELFFEAAPE